MNKKKGISAVVATVLIILITVAAVTIVWAAIIPMIKDQLQEGTVCLDAVNSILIENKGFTCFDNSAGLVNVQVSHGASDIGLTDIQFLISKDGDTTPYLLSDLTGETLPEPNGETVIAVLYALANPDTVAIAPIVSVGNSETTCDASIAVPLTACP